MQSVKELVNELIEFTAELDSRPLFSVGVAELMKIRRMPKDSSGSVKVTEDIRRGRVLTVQEILKEL